MVHEVDDYYMASTTLTFTVDSSEENQQIYAIFSAFVLIQCAYTSISICRSVCVCVFFLSFGFLEIGIGTQSTQNPI